MAFAQKLLTAQIGMASGSYGSGTTGGISDAAGGNTRTFQNLRMVCHVVKPGGQIASTCDLAIFGLSLADMNQMTFLPGIYPVLQTSQNPITVLAGDTSTGLTTIFQGNIRQAFVDAGAMPEVVFRIAATVGDYQSAQKMTPISINGSGDATTIMKQISGVAGWGFENNGVNIKLKNPYYWQNPRKAAAMVALDGGFNHIVDNNTLAIWPAGGSRQGSAAIISPETGMIGYPAFEAPSVIVKTLFNPQVKYGGQVTIQSSLTAANGNWTVTNITYDLEAQVPRGKWIQTITAVKSQGSSQQ